QPYTFTFTTPTARLLSTNWYRPGGRFDAAPIVVLKFNQPIRPEEVAPHVHATFVAHTFVPPVIPQAVQTRLTSIDAGAMPAFTAKVQAVRAAAQSTAPVSLVLATAWDKARFKPAPEMVVLQATPPVPPESWFSIEVDGKVPSVAGSATSGKLQDYVIKVERAFFVDSFYCTAACDPDRRNPIQFREDVKAEAFAAALKATDVTD